MYGSTAPRERRDLHARVAQLDLAPEEHARHLALAAEAPDEAIATLLDSAADSVRRRGAPETAAELAERALHLTPLEHHFEAGTRGITAATLHLQAGDTPRARTLLEDVVRTAPPALPAGRVRSTSSPGFGCGERLRIRDGGSRGCAFPACGRPRTRGHGSDGPVADAAAVGTAQGSGIVHGRRAMRLADDLGLTDLFQSAAVHTATAEFMLGEGVARELAERIAAPADRPGERHGRHSSTANSSQACFSSGQTSLRRHGQVSRRSTQTLPIGATRAQFRPLRFSSANSSAGQATWNAPSTTPTQRTRPFSTRGTRPTRHRLSTSVRSSRLTPAARTRRDRRRSERTRGRRRLRTSSASCDRSGCSAIPELSLGRADLAAQHFRRSLHVAAASGYGEPSVLRIHGDAAETFVAIGALDEAEALLEWLEERGRSLDRRRALAAAARGRAQLPQPPGANPAGRSPRSKLRLNCTSSFGSPSSLLEPSSSSEESYNDARGSAAPRGRA